MKIINGVELPNLDPSSLDPGKYSGTVELRGAEKNESVPFKFDLPGNPKDDAPTNIIGWSLDGDLLAPDAELRTGDILGFSSNPLGIIDHVGIVVDAGNFLHADEKCQQVVCEELNRRRHQIKAVGRLLGT
jgi:hypothetical protein